MLLQKEKVLKACIKIVNDKITFLESAINDLTGGAENDAKSSAGDKHETARSMMQAEQEKLRIQLQEVMKQKASLEKVDTKIITPHISHGSLIKTNKGYLFLAVALGKIKVEEEDIMVLSLHSPLGVKLTGLTINQPVFMNGIEYKIEFIT